MGMSSQGGRRQLRGVGVCVCEWISPCHVLRRRHALLDDVDVDDVQRVRVAGAAVSLLREVQSLLVFVVVSLEHGAPSARQRRPHQSMMCEPIVQEGHQRLPAPVLFLFFCVWVSWSS